MCSGITQALGACLSPDPSPGRLSGLVQCAAVAKDTSNLEPALFLAGRRALAALTCPSVMWADACPSAGRASVPAARTGGGRSWMRLHPARGWLPSGGFRGRSLLRLAGFGSCGPPPGSQPCRCSFRLHVASVCLSVSSLCPALSGHWSLDLGLTWMI